MKEMKDLYNGHDFIVANKRLYKKIVKNHSRYNNHYNYYFCKTCKNLCAIFNKLYNGKYMGSYLEFSIFNYSFFEEIEPLSCNEVIIRNIIK